MTALFMSFYAMLYATVVRAKGWRYPLLFRTEGGWKFKVTRDRIEYMILTRLHSSTFRKFMHFMKKDHMVLATIKDDAIHLNVFRVIQEPEGSPVVHRVWNCHRGENGTFTILVRNGKLVRLTTPKQVKGLQYVESEPMIGFVVPLSHNECAYLDDALAMELPSLNDLEDPAVVHRQDATVSTRKPKWLTT